MNRALALLVSAISAAMANVGFAQTFSNLSTITIRDFNTAEPYPSAINVAGVNGPIGSISITLRGLTHSFPGDLVIGVQGPDGVVYPILNRCGGGIDFNFGNYTFVPRGLAPTLIPIAGTYSVSQCAPTFSLPFVNGPIGDLGDVLGSTAVNGTWSLYVADLAGTDVGSINLGWSITFGPVAGVPADSVNAIVYQGSIATPDGPLSQEVVAQFRLFDAPASGSRVGVPLLMRVTPENGLFSVPLDFGLNLPFDSGQPRWLEVTLDGVTLSPRQRIAPAPQAIQARVATTAQTASTATFATGANAALSVPWAGITGVPANVADLRLNPAALSNSAFINGSVGIGTEPAASSRLLLHQPSLTATQWHAEFTNAAAPAFRGGIRLSDAGFLELSNSANAQFALFARLSNLGSWTTASDARLKTDIRSADGLLDSAMKLRPVYFHWLHADDANGNQEDFGLIAQEAREVLPRLVSGDETKETLTVNYSQLSVVAIGAIQELKAQHDAELAAQQRIIDDLVRRIEALEATNSSANAASEP